MKSSYRNPATVVLERAKAEAEKARRLAKQKDKAEQQLAILRQQRCDNGERLLAVVKSQGGFSLSAPQMRDFCDARGNVNMSAMLKARAAWIEDVKDLIEAAKRDETTHYQWNKDWNLKNSIFVYDPKKVRRA